MFHRVVTAPTPTGFAPNDRFSVTPAALRTTIRTLSNAGFEPVGLDEAHRRLTEGGDRFCVLTFDDGYRDNAELAWPVCREERAPMVVYATTGFMSRTAPVWWYGLERMVAARDTVHCDVANKREQFDTRDHAGKLRAYESLAHVIRNASPTDSRQLVDELGRKHDFDLTAIARDWAMDWDELRRFAEQPGVEIGAHTVHHLSLAAQDEATAREELHGSRQHIERELAQPCRHAAFPFGDASTTGEREFALADQLGFATATTTRHGVARRNSRLTALPRIPSDPFDDARTVAAKISGLPAALLRRG